MKTKMNVTYETSDEVRYLKNPHTLKLPANRAKMEEFIQKNAVLLMNSIVESIDFAVNRDLGVVEIFEFDGSNLTISLFSTDFIPTLDHILQTFVEKEAYENCSRVKEVEKKLIRNNKNIQNAIQEKAKINSRS